jgi:hypothetical protein
MNYPNKFSQSCNKGKPEWIRRGNTIVTMVSGGAFLGVLLAQFPGAIVGAIVAGIFGWYTSKSKTA